MINGNLEYRVEKQPNFHLNYGFIEHTIGVYN